MHFNAKMKNNNHHLFSSSSFRTGWKAVYVYRSLRWIGHSPNRESGKESERYEMNETKRKWNSSFGLAEKSISTENIEMHQSSVAYSFHHHSSNNNNNSGDEGEWKTNETVHRIIRRITKVNRMYKKKRVYWLIVQILVVPHWKSAPKIAIAMTWSKNDPFEHRVQCFGLFFAYWLLHCVRLWVRVRVKCCMPYILKCKIHCRKLCE